MSKPCCNKFAEEAEIQAFVGGGYLYPSSMRPTEQIEYDEQAGNWNVNGCCGGGCYVLRDLMYCPWCGASISNQPTKANKEQL